MYTEPSFPGDHETDVANSVAKRIGDLSNSLSSFAGEQFLDSLVIGLVDALNVDHALIAAFEDDNTKRVHTLAACSLGERVENFQYELCGTPCDEVLQHRVCAYPDRVSELFPNDQLLIDMNVRGYVGAPLMNSEGAPFGILVVLSSSCIEEPDLVRTVLGIVASRTATEIQRLRATRSLQESESRLRDFAELATDWMFELNASLEFSYISPSFELLTMTPPHEFIGQRFCHLLHSDADPQTLPVDLLKARENIVNFDCVFRADSSCLQYWKLSAKPIYGADGAFSGYRGIIRDDTATRQAADHLRRMEKMNAMGQLTGGVAHDFNNLLAIIQGNAELAMDQPENSEELLLEIVEAVGRGASLTQSLLAFGKRQRLETEILQPNKVIKRIQKVLERTLEASFSLETRQTETAWSCKADSGLLENAIINLVLNARDAMPGGGRILLSCEGLSLTEEQTAALDGIAPGRYVVFSVADEGTGMPPEVLARAHEPFFSTKPQNIGSGLGLSMVFGFAQQSNGHLAIETSLKGGTVVRLYLPCADQTEDAGELDGPDEVSRLCQKRILVVEDNPTFLRLFQKFLLSRDLDAVLASSGSEAITHLQNNGRFDVLITDIQLGDTHSGFDVALVARQIRPDINVIYMTGYSDEVAKECDRVDGPILRKPFRLKDIADIL